MTFSDEQLLDLDGISYRASGFTFELLTPALVKIGDLAPFRDEIPTIENNGNRSIKRTLDGLALTPAESAAVNTLNSRVRVSMVLPNGTALRLGVFLFADNPRVRHTYGTPVRASLVDQCFMLDQPVEVSVSYAAGQDVAAALASHFDVAGVPFYAIEISGVTLGSPVAWPAGTSRLKIMNHLAAIGGAYSVFFDHDGFGRVRRVPDLTLSNIDVTYEEGGRIYRGSIVETNDLLSAPNRYIVIDSTNPDTPVTGYFDVPDEAPHSIVNRGGLVIPTVIDTQGIGTVEQAEARARAAYAQDSSTFEWVDFDSPPDPRHDTFAVVSYLGNLYREQSWSLPCVEGSAMSHSLRRIY